MTAGQLADLIKYRDNYVIINKIISYLSWD